MTSSILGSAQRPVVEVFSRLLNRSFQVSVDVFNDFLGASVHGTLSFDGGTIEVDATWTGGCSDGIGTWNGTFVVSV